MMHHQPKTGAVPPLLLSVLATSIGLLVNREELDRAVEEHVGEIRRLSAMSDQELRSIGITRDQITAYVLHESADD